MSATFASMWVKCRRQLVLGEPQTDRELLHRFQTSADVDAFEELLERYAP